MGDNAFALMPWLVKPYCRTHLTKEDKTTGSPEEGGSEECI